MKLREWKRSSARCHDHQRQRDARQYSRCHRLESERPGKTVHSIGTTQGTDLAVPALTVMARFFPNLNGGRRISAGLVLVALAGCATSEVVDYSATRASWQGAPYDAVVAQWG